MAKYLSFNTKDWLSDTFLRGCSPAARGIWIDMLCLMFESSSYGFLLINGSHPSIKQLSRIFGCSAIEMNRHLNELQSAGVFSRNAEGVIFCRKMVRVSELSQIRKDCGALGGSPLLIQSIPEKKQKKKKTAPETQPVVKEKKEVFVKPTVEQVRDCMAEFSISGGVLIDANKEASLFFDYFEAKGWRVGASNSKMKSWGAAARNWVRNSAKFRRNTIQEKPGLRDIYDAL